MSASARAVPPSPMNMLLTLPPVNETQQRILDATIACVKQWGVEKTSLNDIAKMAGVTRPTVYSYFGSRDQVVSAALMRSAVVFGQRLMTHLARFRTPQERYIESLLFSLAELPKEPYLAVITQTNVSPFVNKDAMMNEHGWALTLALFREILAGVSMSEEDLYEIAEITIRLQLSLLTTNGPRHRSRDEMRAFLQRRLLPMLQLKTTTVAGRGAAPIKAARRARA